MVNSDPRGDNNGTKAGPKAKLSVSVAQQPVPMLPHERDESVETQGSSPKAASENSNSAPAIKSRVNITP